VVCEKLCIFADSPKERRLHLVHARQTKKVEARHGCDATLLYGGAARIDDIAANPAEIVAVA